MFERFFFLKAKDALYFGVCLDDDFALKFFESPTSNSERELAIC